MSDSITALHDMLHDLCGKRIDGGCESCDAYQTIHLNSTGARIVIRHDDGCPVLESAVTR